MLTLKKMKKIVVELTKKETEYIDDHKKLMSEFDKLDMDVNELLKSLKELH